MPTNSPIRQTRRRKILVADDDLGILDAVRILLEEFDYEVETISNAQKLYKINKSFPDLILLDIWMSGIDGGEICKYLKSKKGTRDIPIIIISANKGIAKIAKAAGADDFIPKPFELQELISKIEKYTM